MKKVLFALILLVGTSSAFAQINKGQWLVGGNAGFTSSKWGEEKNTSFEFSPDAGYFFAKQFAGGLRASITSSKDDGDDDAYSSLLVAPFLRYYFMPAAQKVSIFADASYGFGSQGAGDKTSVSGFKFMAGPAVFLSPNTALEFTLGYQSLKMEDVDDRANSFGVNVGFQIHLGKSK